MHLLVLGAVGPAAKAVRGAFGGLNAPSGAGCFLTPLPLGTASLRHFQGLERHRLRRHPAGPAGTAPI